MQRFPDKPEYMHGLAKAEIDRGLQFQHGEQLSQALSALRRSRTLLDNLAKAAPNDRISKSQIDCLLATGQSLERAEQPLDATEIYRQAIAIGAQLVKQNPFPDHRCKLATIYGSLARAQEEAGQGDPRNEP